MKEFIDKLISRLEERRNKFAPQQCIDYAEGLTDGYEGSIRIVNELAEEYNVSEIPTGSEDCCEWRLIDYEANVYDTTCRNPHILLEGSPTDNSYEFCPYCGKEIKVAPYTEGE